MSIVGHCVVRSASTSVEQVSFSTLGTHGLCPCSRGADALGCSRGRKILANRVMVYVVVWWSVLRWEGRAGRGWGSWVGVASSPRDFCAVSLPSLGPVSSTSVRTAPSAALSAPGLVSQEPSASPVLVEQFGRVSVTESEALCCVFAHHSFSLPQRGPSVRWAPVCCLPGVHRTADLRGAPGGQGGAEGEVVAARR